METDNAMTLQDFVKDYLPLIQLLISALGLVSIFLLFLQIRQATMWNRLNSNQAFYNERYQRTETSLHLAAKTAGVILKARLEPLTEEEVNKLWSNDEAYYALTDLMNCLESVSAQIRAGALESEIAYSTYGIPLVGYYRVLKPVFKRIREANGNDDALIEWEILAEHYSEKDQELTETRLKESKLTQRLRGIRKKVR